ncbi:MAG: class I SAM-dependent methyltransferase [Pseudomonadota bacterium]
MQTVDFDRVPFQSADVVLDLGCGEGRHVISTFLEADVHSIGVDLCHQDLLTTRRKFDEFADASTMGDTRSFSLAQTNALHLPFADNTFDTVICSEVLEHIPDYQAVIVEIERVLRPGGQFVASVPRYWPEWICWAFSDEYHANEGGHLRIFNAGKLRRQIEQAGFDFEARHWAHALHSPYWWLQCMFWRTKDQSRMVKLYQRFLEWDILDRPRFTRWLEALLNPVMGKSVVMYFQKGVIE